MPLATTAVGSSPGAPLNSSNKRSSSEVAGGALAHSSSGDGSSSVWSAATRESFEKRVSLPGATAVSDAAADCAAPLPAKALEFVEVDDDEPIFSRPPPLPQFQRTPSSASVGDLVAAPVVTVAPPSPKMFMPPASCLVADYNIVLPKTPRSANSHSNALVPPGGYGEFYGNADEALAVVCNPLRVPIIDVQHHNHQYCASLLSPAGGPAATCAVFERSIGGSSTMKHVRSWSWNTTTSPGCTSRWSSSRSSPVVHLTTSASGEASPSARVAASCSDTHVAEGSAGEVSSTAAAIHPFAEGATPSCQSPVYNAMTSFKNVILPLAPDSPKTSRSTSLASKSHVSVLLYGGGDDDEYDDGGGCAAVPDSASSSSSRSLLSNANVSHFNKHRRPSLQLDADGNSFTKPMKRASTSAVSIDGDDEDVCATNEVSVSYDEDDVEAAHQQNMAQDRDRCPEDDETFRHLEASDIVDSDALLGSPETNAELVARVRNAVRHWKPISGDSLAALTNASQDAAAVRDANKVVSPAAPSSSFASSASPAPSSSVVISCGGTLLSPSAACGGDNSDAAGVASSTMAEDSFDSLSFEDLLKWSNDHQHLLDDETSGSGRRRRYPRHADGTLILSAIPPAARLEDSRVQQHAAMLRQCSCDDVVTSPSFAGCRRQRCFSTIAGSLFTVPPSETAATPLTPRAASLGESSPLALPPADELTSPRSTPKQIDCGELVAPPSNFLGGVASPTSALLFCRDLPHGAQRARRQRRLQSPQQSAFQQAGPTTSLLPPPAAVCHHESR